MKAIAVAGAAFMVGLILCGCASGRRSAPVVHTHWQPWTNEVTTAKQLASALESRWDLETIRAYCEATRPTPDSIQNLVALGEFWKGNLHEGKASGFDRVSWYAAVRNGKLEEYSVNATKGRKHWILEIGNQESLSKLPVLSRTTKPEAAQN